MINEIEKLDSQRINEIAKELAQYGLGICKPHLHAEDGTLTPAKSGFISLEQNMHVRFVSVDQVPSNVIAVGWRWNGNELEVCAGCCGPGGPDHTNPARKS